MEKYRIVIHGGAGTIRKSDMTPALEKAYHEGLKEALSAGKAILEQGGEAVDAVTEAVKVLENNPLFNAGLGAVFTHAGTHELDASIMDGRDKTAGAVAAVKHVKNPILLAKTILHHSSHVLMLGEGAEAFAQLHGLERVENDYFATDFRRAQWEKIRHLDKVQLDHVADSKSSKRGTVGAVAMDKMGNLAAATSTGGMTNKKFGRVGDTAIIGAGTYADNAVCAISATGWGEFFIRGVVAYDIAARMMYKNESIQTASDAVIMHKLSQLSPIDGEYGDGGIIGIDARGNIVMPFNTEGMYRGYLTEEGECETFIYA